jgi:hypothetical protein
MRNVGLAPHGPDRRTNRPGGGVVTVSVSLGVSGIGRDGWDRPAWVLVALGHSH